MGVNVVGSGFVADGMSCGIGFGRGRGEVLWDIYQYEGKGSMDLWI